MAKHENMDMETQRRFRAALREKRDEDLGISTNRLAAIMDTDPATLRKFLQGTRETVGIDMFIRARKKLHMDINRVIDLPPNKKYDGPDPPPNEKAERPRPSRALQSPHPVEHGAVSGKHR